MTNQSTKPPVWFWIVTTLALLWNLAGVFNYLLQAYATPEMMEAMPKHQREYMENTPAWVTVCFALAVWGGTLGCFLLLIRKQSARVVLIISLLGIIGQVGHSFLLSNAYDVYGPGGVVMPVMIVLIGVGLVLLTRKGIVSGWLK